MRKKFQLMQELSRTEKSSDWQTRLGHINQLEKLINDNRATIIKVINQDFGRRSKSETLMAEIVPTLQEIKYSQKHGNSWLKKRCVKTNFWFLPARSYIQPQPLGVVGIMVPWNYPLFLCVVPLIGALLAGNRVMIKLSELTPNFAEWFQSAIKDYFPDDLVQVIIGDINISQEFTTLPFDHLLFTGSSLVGRHIMSTAAKNLTPVTLELGGKSPVIIDKTVDLKKAVERIWIGKLINAGQTCIAPDYVLLPESMKQEFIKLSKQFVNTIYPDIENNTDYTFLINRNSFDRISLLLNDSQKLNANNIALTEFYPNLNTNFMPPYIVTGLPSDSDLLTQEIFGPILPIVTVTDTSQAVEYINARPRPLALYVFSSDKIVCNQVIQGTTSGGVCINDTIYHVAQHELPFGGIGESGMGKCHGKSSFDTFTHYKSIFHQSRFNTLGFLKPPYGKFFSIIMNIISGRPG